VAALYEEFGIHPELREGMIESAVGYSPDVVACASQLYDHNYDVTFALEHILQVWLAWFAYMKLVDIDSRSSRVWFPLFLIFGAFSSSKHSG